MNGENLQQDAKYEFSWLLSLRYKEQAVHIQMRLSRLFLVLSQRQKHKWGGIQQ